MSRARTFHLVTFGCRVNQAEGEALAARLRRAGWAETANGAAADLVIVNSCAVTAEAARQARQRARRAARDDAAVVLTGCAAHPAAADLGALPGLLFAEPDKDRAAERLLRGPAPPPRAEEPPGRPAGAVLPRPAAPPAGAAHADGRAGPPTAHPRPAPAVGARGWNDDAPAPGGDGPDRSRALLKVQDGCSAACAYCIVPLVRPTVRSLPPEAAAARAADLVAQGFREIVLCGIHLGLYGADLGPGTDPASVDSSRGASAPGGGGSPGPPHADLAALVRRLLAVPGLGRLRLSSLEPMEVTDDLLGMMAAEPDRLCPHLHLPLQSGDDAVLARMGRPYTAAGFLAVVARVRAALDRPALTTDVLVGFPGETDEALAATLRVCRGAGFSRIHVFPFSRRPGTPAAGMRPQVPAAVVRARRAEAAALGAALAAEYRASLVGREARVAVERLAADGSAEGLAERFVRVRVRGPLPPGVRRRDLLPVRLVGLEAGGLLAEPRP